jgi:hypothetical protein
VAQALALKVDLQAEVGKYRAHEFQVAKTDPDRAFTAWLGRAGQMAEEAAARRPAPGFRSHQDRQPEYIKPPYHRSFSD